MKLTVLGSTGSIGVQALEVARQNRYEIAALAAGHNVELAESQARRYLPAVFAMGGEKAAADLKQRLADTPVRVIGGSEAVCQAAREPADTVLNAIVGIAGLAPTLAALEAGRTLALANKESLVTGGELVMQTAARVGVKILPVDSEHSAIFQSINGETGNPIKKIFLTSSGGPFFGKTPAELASVSRPQALKHPNWQMGPKITIDCATLMNKGLELIEAVRLFDVKAEQVQILIHRQSVLHSAVMFCDNSVIGQMGVPDMRLPIQYALTWPRRCPSLCGELDLAAVGSLTFSEPDDAAFPAPSLCRAAVQKGGAACAVVNGANEAAVGLFLQDKISFLQITELVGRALDTLPAGRCDTPDAIFEADRAARDFVLTTAGHRRVTH